MTPRNLMILRGELLSIPTGGGGQADKWCEILKPWVHKSVYAGVKLTTALPVPEEGP